MERNNDQGVSYCLKILPHGEKMRMVSNTMSGFLSLAMIISTIARHLSTILNHEKELSNRF